MCNDLRCTKNVWGINFVTISASTVHVELCEQIEKQTADSKRGEAGLQFFEGVEPRTTNNTVTCCIVLFKAQLGDPFLGIRSLVFHLFLFFFHLFFVFFFFLIFFFHLLSLLFSFRKTGTQESKTGI